MLINWICHTIWVRFTLVCQKSLRRIFKTGFEYKIIFWIFVLELWIHKGYFVVKKLFEMLYLSFLVKKTVLLFFFLRNRNKKWTIIEYFVFRKVPRNLWKVLRQRRLLRSLQLKWRRRHLKRLQTKVVSYSSLGIL